MDEERTHVPLKKIGTMKVRFMPPKPMKPRRIETMDLVNHPPHYTQGSMEVIEAIEGLRLNFHEGNVVKYVARWQHKGGVEDLKKARWYLERLIDQVDEKESEPEENQDA